MSYYLVKPPFLTQDFLEIDPVFILHTTSSETLCSFCENWMEQSRKIYSEFKNFEYSKKNILKFVRPSRNSTYDCFNAKGIKHLTRLYLDLSHLRHHKFKHCFLIHFRSASAVLTLKETAIFYSIAPILWMKDHSFWTMFQDWPKINCLLVTLQLSNFSFMVIIYWIW